MPISKPSAESVPVSAVVPCYRCSDTIRRAVDSIAAQSAPPREVILVDDCSGDSTPEALRRIASAHPAGWVKVLELPANGGAGHARNAGWEAATQPYVAFLDADDAWHTKKLEIQYGWMQAHAEAELTGHLTAWARDGRIPATDPRAVKVERIDRRRLLLGNCFSLRSVMVRREFPIRFHREKRYMEDYWWVLQAAFSGYDVRRIELPLAFIFKAPYGAGGLSARQWQMEKSELDNYWGLRKQGKLGLLAAFALTIYSLLKYAKRVLVATCRRRYDRPEAPAGHE
jgi:glycosyltransferase involved in cell wall biosynthesis